MYKGIVFDFDGTIADTMKQNYQAWCYALNQFDFVIDEKQYYLEEGKTPKAIVSSYTNDEDIIAKIMELKDNYFIAQYQLNLYEGVVELLNQYKNIKKLALVTGGGTKRINYILKKANLIHYFDVIVTANDVTRGKPDKEPYMQALDKLNLEAKDCIVIENAPSGIVSAKAANIFCVALETTLNKKELVMADLILNNFNELLTHKILK